MEYGISLILFLCFFFFLAGFVDSIAGGGGLISLPAVLISGIPPHVALGTSKCATTLGSLSSLWTFFRSGFVVTRIAPLGFASAFIGSCIGTWIAMLLDSATFGRVLVFMLPIGMLISLFSGKAKDNVGEKMTESHLAAKVIFVGVSIGIYDGFFGPGAGSFYILLLHIVLKLRLVPCSATAKVFNMASNAGSLLVFASGGVVVWSLAVPLAIANILGNQLGTRLAIRVGAKAVRVFLYIALTLLFITLVYRFFLSSMF